MQEEYKKISEDNTLVKEIGVCYMHLDGYLLYLPRDVEALFEISESESEASDNEQNIEPMFSFVQESEEMKKKN